MTQLPRWMALAQALCDDPDVAAKLRLALEDPDAYFEQHQDALDERGIDDAGDVSAAVALVDALLATGDAAYLDWKASPADVAGELGRLPRVREANADLSETARLDGHVEAAIATVNRSLASAGLVCVAIDEDSDAYPLVVAPLDRLSTLRALSDELEDVLAFF